MKMKMFCSVLHSTIDDNKSHRVQQAEESKKPNCSVEVYRPETKGTIFHKMYSQLILVHCKDISTEKVNLDCLSSWLMMTWHRVLTKPNIPMQSFDFDYLRWDLPRHTHTSIFFMTKIY